MDITAFLVDDHTVVRDGLRMVLEANPGIKVIGEAANGRDAVRRIVEEPPDVVIMDISMPDLNGIEATRILTDRNIPSKIIILSMHTVPEQILRALRAGARGYLAKESAAKEVVKAIRAVQAGRRYMSEQISDQVIDDYLRRGTDSEEDPLSLLSSREREVLQLIVEGRSTAEIAETAALAVKTVETYRSRLMRKLEISSIADLVKFAIQHGITSV